MVVLLGEQEGLHFLVDFPALLGIQFHLLFLELLVDPVVLPVGVVAGGALQVHAAHDAVHVQHHLAFTLAGQFPVAGLVSRAGGGEEVVTGGAGVGLEIGDHDVQRFLKLVLDHRALLGVGANLPHVHAGLEAVGIAGLDHKFLGPGQVSLALGSVLGAQAGPGLALLEAVGQAHERAAHAGGVVEDQVVPLLVIDGQSDSLAHLGVVEGLLLDVEHQAPVRRRLHRHAPVLAVGVPLQLEHLGRGHVGETAVGHVNLAALELGDQHAGVHDDGVVDAVEVGLAVLEVVGVLGHLVEAAPLVLVQHEGAGTGIVLNDALGQVQVNALVQDVLGQHLYVVHRQELNEGAGGELQVEFDGVVVNHVDAAVAGFQGVLAPETGAAHLGVQVAVAKHGIVNVIGVELLPVQP